MKDGLSSRKRERGAMVVLSDCSDRRYTNATARGVLLHALDRSRLVPANLACSLYQLGLSLSTSGGWGLKSGEKYGSGVCALVFVQQARGSGSRVVEKQCHSSCRRETDLCSSYYARCACTVVEKQDG